MIKLPTVLCIISYDFYFLNIIINRISIQFINFLSNNMCSKLKKTHFFYFFLTLFYYYYNIFIERINMQMIEEENNINNF